MRAEVGFGRKALRALAVADHSLCGCFVMVLWVGLLPNFIWLYVVSPLYLSVLCVAFGRLCFQRRKQLHSPYILS